MLRSRRAFGEELSIRRPHTALGLLGQNALQTLRWWRYQVPTRGRLETPKRANGPWVVGKVGWLCPAIIYTIRKNNPFVT